MPYVYACADGAFTRFQIVLYGIQRGIFHDQHQIRCREHRRQDAVLEAICKMARFDAKGIYAARAYRYLFHGASRFWLSAVLSFGILFDRHADWSWVRRQLEVAPTRVNPQPD